jgi:hypothetical protein
MFNFLQSNWVPVIAAFIAGFFALTQIRANNITNSRIRWLENLKNILSEFTSECTVLTIEEGVSKTIKYRQSINESSEEADGFLKNANNKIIDRLKTISIKHDLLKLNLNPKENLHLKFEKHLDAYMELINQIPLKKTDHILLSKKISKQEEMLLLLSRLILKLEWEKTKRSYLSFKYYTLFGKGKEIKKEVLQVKLEENE